MWKPRTFHYTQSLWTQNSKQNVIRLRVDGFFSINSNTPLQHTQQHNTSHNESSDDQNFNLSDGSNGYFESEIVLSDMDFPDFESDNHATICAFEKSAYSWSADANSLSARSSTSNQQLDSSYRKKKFTKTRAPTPFKPPTFSQKYSIGP